VNDERLAFDSSFPVHRFRDGFLFIPLIRPLPIKKHPLTTLDRVAYLIATGLGAGFSPVGPGTCGAIEAVAIYFATGVFGLTPVARLVVVAGLAVFTCMVGVWASARTCEICEVKDPGQVVVDEVCGQLVALMPVALASSPQRVALAFVLFRLLDIFKPYPIRRVESLPGGFGVMADDVLAGLYGAGLVAAAIYFKLI